MFTQQQQQQQQLQQQQKQQQQQHCAGLLVLGKSARAEAPPRALPGLSVSLRGRRARRRCSCAGEEGRGYEASWLHLASGHFKSVTRLGAHQKRLFRNQPAEWTHVRRARHAGGCPDYERSCWPGESRGSAWTLGPRDATGHGVVVCETRAGGRAGPITPAQQRGPNETLL
ncbi:unnamed protein product [Lampetra fluviatilis]